MIHQRFILFHVHFFMDMIEYIDTLIYKELDKYYYVKFSRSRISIREKAISVSFW